MPISMKWLDYDYTNSGGAPNRGGVYELADRDVQIIYVGASKDVNDALMAHLRRQDNVAKKSRYVRWEVAETPAARQQELLGEFQKQYGKLPADQGVTAPRA